MRRRITQRRVSPPRTNAARSSFDFVALSFAFPSFRLGRAGWLFESAVIERHVSFHLFKRDLRLVRATLEARLDRMRQVDAGHLFVIAERCLELTLRAAYHYFVFDLYRDVIVRVHEIIAHVAVFQRHLELEGVSAFHRFRAGELDLIAFLPVIDERPIEISLQLNLLQFVFAERFCVLLASPRLDLPAGLAVVSCHAGHSLNRKLQPRHLRALFLLNDDRLKAAAASKLARAPQRFDGLDLLRPADSLDVFGDNLLSGLRRNGYGEKRQPNYSQ